MNKKGDDNRSVRNTKRRIREAFLAKLREKPINSITAKELSDTVDINRGTFYLHYTDVFDLMHKIEDDFFNDFSNLLNNTEHEKISEYFTVVFTFLGNNKEFCKLMLGPHGDLNFIHRIELLLQSVCVDFWKKDNIEINMDNVMMFNSFLIYGCMGLLKNWFEGGMKQSVEELSSFVYKYLSAVKEKELA